MIAIVDSGTGNLQSVSRAFARVGAQAVVTQDPEVVRQARGIVLPGVGAAAAAMTVLRSHGLIESLRERVIDQGTPCLGICLGMQLLAERSEEGEGPAMLSWMPGIAQRLRWEDPSWKIPHLGWSVIEARSTSRLFQGVPAEAWFYFAHSFALTQIPDTHIAAHASYGGRFVAAVERENLFGVQFHPEKSQANGLLLLANFARLL